MISIEATATVDANGTLTIPVGNSLPPGQHRVVLRVREEASNDVPLPDFLARLKPHSGPVKDPTCTYRRGDLYSDFHRFSSMIEALGLSNACSAE